MIDDETSLERDLEQTLLGFDSIQSELNYKQAREALQSLISALDLTPRERAGLEPEIQELSAMLDKLEQQVVHIAVFGMVGRGKSSVLNALLGQKVFETGPVHGVTRTSESASWTVDEAETPRYRTQQDTLEGSNQTLLRLSLPGIGQSRLELIDTPGIDEVDGETREALAQQVAQKVDLILFVIAGDMTKVEHTALAELRRASKPILLVFNKIDQYPEADRQAVYQKVRDERVRELLSPEEIVMTAASPLVPTATQQPDGKWAVQLIPGAPQVDELKLKILEILHREGKSLVALNTMLYADVVNEHLVQRKMQIRDRAANQIIWNAVMAKAVAIALNPLTVVDLLSGAVIDLAMILSLSKLYGINMTQTGAVGLLRKIAISMGGISASELLANLGLGSLKSLLGLSAPATAGLSVGPYVSVALTQGAVGGASAYGIGQITKTYLANGASWGPEGPKAVVNQILASLDETSILNRIKDELRAKLDWQHRVST
jgi:small GTP-binding protein